MTALKQPSQKSFWTSQDGRLTPEAMNFLQSIINVLNGQEDGSYTFFDFFLFRLTVGSTAPNGNVRGSPPDLYLRTTGGASTTLYVKESGSNTTAGWVGK